MCFRILFLASLKVNIRILNRLLICWAYILHDKPQHQPEASNKAIRPFYFS